MKTSYFARINSKKFPDSFRERGVSISLSCRWWSGKRYKPLFPPKDIIMLEDYEEYRVQYYERVLNQLDPQQVWDDIVGMAGRDAILLCHESEQDILSGKKFCHRRVVAEWLEENLWEKIPEVGKLDYEKMDYGKFGR